ncbi:MAG: UDP-N-acetylmuramoyl-L-alanine--D-glutamate ligase [Alphaproteobacteria bacterium]|nr:UDP-N-acetylmuramoyl-L-alanine--D-glutamate ligase [Alphaproteobacteria bacterium]
MIPATTFSGARVAVFGLGRSGISTCRSLSAGGATVLAWDENERARVAAEADGIDLTDLGAADWSAIDSLVLAPGVPLTHPHPHWTVNRAREAGVEVIGDVEIFARERQACAAGAPFIAITGTNGKSTTTALIAHALAATGRDSQMGGNIGVPILSLEPPKTDRFHVVEMSSYQIDLTPTLNPSVGILLNLSPDHIDRHGTFENYATIKARLPRCADTAIVGVDDPTSATIAQDLQASHPRTVAISVRARPVAGYYAEDGRIYNVRDGARGVVADLDGLPSLRGLHNAQNAMAMFAALAAFDIQARELTPALATFPGLAHRMEEIGRRNAVVFINDSKATNADSTAVALAAFEKDIYWICGGRAKEGGIAELAPYFPRISRAYLIGEAEDAFAAQLEGRVAYARCGTLEIATAAAARDAASGSGTEPVVLLAPACASFDQYASFEARGDHFRDIVTALPGIGLREAAC